VLVAEARLIIGEFIVRYGGATCPESPGSVQPPALCTSFALDLSSDERAFSIDQTSTALEYRTARLLDKESAIFCVAGLLVEP
jgi:hypothetical protein